MMFREVCFEAVVIEVLNRWTYNCSLCLGRVSTTFLVLLSPIVMIFQIFPIIVPWCLSPISVATRNDISAGISIMSFQPKPPNYPCPMQQKSDDLDLPTHNLGGDRHPGPLGRSNQYANQLLTINNPLKKAGYFVGGKHGIFWETWRHFLGKDPTSLATARHGRHPRLANWEAKLK